MGNREGETAIMKLNRKIQFALQETEKPGRLVPYFMSACNFLIENIEEWVREEALYNRVMQMIHRMLKDTQKRPAISTLKRLEKTMRSAR